MNAHVLRTPFSHVKANLVALKGNAFARNLGSLGSAQIAIRLSRLLATVMLSRMLLPEQFGLAAVVLTVYELMAIFTRNGITAKVVQSSAEDLPVAAMTAYHMTWSVCGGLMLIQLLMAWPIAWFYNDMSIAWPIAAMAVIYLATPLCSVQAAMQQREGRLGRFAMASATQVVTDNILTLLLALSGFGMWAIILPKIIVAPIWTIFVRYGHSWRPQRNISPSAFHGWKDIARFSRSVLGVELLTTLQANMDNFLVGYFFGLHALGLYYFAFNSGLGITIGLINAAGIAVYPHLCAVRQDKAALRQRAAKTMRTLALLLVPVILMQAMLSPFYVPMVFGEQWNDAVPALALICLSALMRPLTSVTSQLLKATARPEIEVRWQFATTVVLGAALLVGCQFNITAVAVAVFLVQIVMQASFIRSAWSQSFPSNNKSEFKGALS
jgi:teichuronic acid exporter